MRAACASSTIGQRSPIVSHCPVPVPVAHTRTSGGRLPLPCPLTRPWAGLRRGTATGWLCWCRSLTNLSFHRSRGQMLARGALASSRATSALRSHTRAMAAAAASSGSAVSVRPRPGATGRAQSLTFWASVHATYSAPAPAAGPPRAQLVKTVLADSIKPASTHPLKVTAPGGSEASLLLVKVSGPVFRAFPVAPSPGHRGRAPSVTFAGLGMSALSWRVRRVPLASSMPP